MIQYYFEEDSDDSDYDDSDDPDYGFKDVLTNDVWWWSNNDPDRAEDHNLERVYALARDFGEEFFEKFEAEVKRYLEVRRATFSVRLQLFEAFFLRRWSRSSSLTTRSA